MIIRHTSFDATVDNIGERNQLTNLVDNMTVTVLDAIADMSAGPGTAIYRWSEAKNSWIIVSKESTDTLKFDTEELLIVNGKVTPKNIPTDFKIWDVAIVDGNSVIVYPRPEELAIDTTGINGLTAYNGKKIRFTYAYGTIASQITTAIEDYVDKSLLNNIKTINGQEVLGTGDIVIEGTVPEFKTINNESIVGTGNINIITDISGKADKATTAAGYGITDVYTKTEVENLINSYGSVSDFDTALN